MIFKNVSVTISCMAEIPIPWENFRTLRHHNLVKFLGYAVERHWRPGPLSSLKAREYIAELKHFQREGLSHEGTIVFLGTIPWHHILFQRSQQLARAFARLGYLVFYCDPPWYFWTPLGVRALEPNLYLCRLPLPAFRVLKKPIVHLSLATNKRYLNYFRDVRVIYDYLDELEVFGIYGRERLARDHKALLREAHIVIASSERLADKAKTLRPDVLLCPNGVDHSFFVRCLTEEFPAPVELEPLVRQDVPLIGFYGALACWIDYKLLVKVARTFSSWAIILIGPDHDGNLFRSRILQESNIYWLGPKPYTVLPHYLQALDVMIIPFIINSVTLSTSPIKLFEYMAAGKQVVTVDLLECRKYAGVLVAKDQDEFITLLAKAQSTCRDTTAQAARSRAILSEDWQKRAQQIAIALESLGQ